MKVLDMHPKFLVYKKINKIDQIIELEKTFEKLRWENHRRQTSNNNIANETNDDDEGSEVNESNSIDTGQSYDPTTRSLGISSTRPTSLPCNKWVYRPPLHIHNPETEVRMTYAKQRIKEELAMYNNKGQENISKETRKGLRSLLRKEPRKARSSSIPRINRASSPWTLERTML